MLATSSSDDDEPAKPLASHHITNQQPLKPIPKSALNSNNSNHTINSPRNLNKVNSNNNNNDNRSVESNSFSISNDDISSPSRYNGFNNNDKQQRASLKSASHSIKSANNLGINASISEKSHNSSLNTSFSSKYGDDNENGSMETATKHDINCEDEDESLDSLNKNIENTKLVEAKANEEKERIEIENHRKLLQIYVLVCRCIAYPFIAKQSTDMLKRPFKLTRQQLIQIKDNFDSFLNGKLQIEADEAFTNAVRSYYEVFLKSDRVAKMVANGCFSIIDFRDVFRNNIEKRVRSLPEIDGLSKETVLNSWIAKFDAIFKINEDSRRQSKNTYYLTNSSLSETTFSKEQLYDMFQSVLSIKKFEHQLIFNAAQVR
jgi:hypothetical protein